MNDYGQKENKGYRYILVVIDNFTRFGWSVPLKNKNAQRIKVLFVNFLICSKRKPKITESDGGKELENRIFTDLLNRKAFERNSRYTTKGSVFAETFTRINRKLLKIPVSDKINADWIDEILSVTKKYITKISVTKLTPLEASP